MDKFQEVTVPEVIKIIQEGNSKSCSLDILPTNLVKDMLPVLAEVFTELFNVSLSSGIFPDGFKEAVVRPVLKKAGLDVNILKNFRPLSNLSVLSKYLEKIVVTQITKYLSENDLYMKYQSAYRAYYSTETALLRVQNDVLCALNDRKDVVLVMLDLSAAFDTLDHTILLHILQERFGFTGTVLNWFQSYLSNRHFRVSIDSLPASHEFELEFGVPQGSVLGPILFTLYTSPLEDIFSKHSVNSMLYADDSQLYIVSEKLQDDIGSLEGCTDEVRDWMKSHLLILNEDKTELVHFTSVLKPDAVKLGSLRVGSCDITPSQSVRNLGVMFDDDGIMTSQVNVMS
ncbi:hypothetical protein SNE40_003011 [Patella caerulea]|uniref:Reverse transcriptase domain-containing protein n=1 Tax=Patella caerulea TaxID=87958 RepID=A0AAN8K6Z3_PATCE